MSHEALGESRFSSTGGPAEPAFISCVYVAYNCDKQHITLVCIFTDFLALCLGPGHET